MSIDPPPEPWHSFLTELDNALGTQIVLHCHGGFVVTMLYGCPRQTEDIDCLEILPNDQVGRVLDMAGMSSPLHDTHGVYLQHVGFLT